MLPGVSRRCVAVCVRGRVTSIRPLWIIFNQIHVLQCQQWQQRIVGLAERTGICLKGADQICDCTVIGQTSRLFIFSYWAWFCGPNTVSHCLSVIVTGSHSGFQCAACVFVGSHNTSRSD